MVDRKDGLIVNISSAGGMVYIFNTAYGAGKAAVDKMAHDCGTELKKQNVTMVSLWPGPVRTEKIDAQMTSKNTMQILLIPFDPTQIIFRSTNPRPKQGI